MDEKRRIAEDRRTIREALAQRWRVEFKRYNEVDIPAWQAAYAEVDRGCCQ